MHKPPKLFGAFVLSVFLPLSAQAADRHTLSTQVPETAAHLPMLNRLPATNRLELAIGLPFRNQDILTNLVRQLYDRRSTNFHRYLTPERFAQQFGPTEQDYQNVINYAKSNRLVVVRTFGNRAVLDVAGQVSDIEGMFHVHLGFYQHPTENRTFYAPDVPPTVDASLSIINVSGLDNYFISHHYGHGTPIDKNQIHKRNGGPVSEGGSLPFGDITLYGGADFRHAYASGASLNGAGQVVGLFEKDGYTPSDIYDYETNAGLPIVTLENVLESFTPGGGNLEVASDIELVIAMAPGIRQVNVYEGNNADTIINEIASPEEGEPLPNQISSSWGINGDATIEQDLIEMARRGNHISPPLATAGLLSALTRSQASIFPVT